MQEGSSSRTCTDLSPNLQRMSKKVPICGQNCVAAVQQTGKRADEISKYLEEINDAKEQSDWLGLRVCVSSPILPQGVGDSRD